MNSDLDHLCENSVSYIGTIISEVQETLNQKFTFFYDNFITQLRNAQKIIIQIVDKQFYQQVFNQLMEIIKKKIDKMKGIQEYILSMRIIPTINLTDIGHQQLNQCPDLDLDLFKSPQQPDLKQKTMERKTRCPKCKEILEWGENLNTHTSEQHQSIIAYKCPIFQCGSIYAKSDELADHLLLKHGEETDHIDKLKYTCEYNGQIFKGRKVLSNYISERVEYLKEIALNSSTKLEGLLQNVSKD